MGLRLLTRTTRSVAPTNAGERLLLTVGPRLDEIDSELAALNELREKPAGNRIGPEPCDAIRKGCVEASAGERTGQPLSRGAPGDRQEVEGESPLR